MRYLWLLVIFIAFSPFSFAHESDIDHVHSADVAVVESNLVVQGTVVVQDWWARTGLRHKVEDKFPDNSTIINDFICWQNMTYTLNPLTGKLGLRSVNDQKNNLPSLKIVKIEDGVVHLEYKDEKLEAPFVFKKKLKLRS